MNFRRSPRYRDVKQRVEIKSVGDMSPLLTSHSSVTSKVFTKCSHPCLRCHYTMLWQACREQIWLYRVLVKIHYARYKSLKSCTTSQFVKNINSTFAKKRFRCKAGNDKKEGGWLSQVTIKTYCSEKLNQFTLRAVDVDDTGAKSVRA